MKPSIGEILQILEDNTGNHYENLALIKSAEEIHALHNQATKPLGENNWTIPNQDGLIDVPDHLMPLFNSIGNQMRFHTISGAGEVITVARMVYAAEKFFNETTETK